MKNLSPEQAWEKIKATNPNAKYIYRVLRDGWAVEPIEPGIDWPPGVDRWPPPDPRWREPTMADVGKMVDFCQYKEFDSIRQGKLVFVRECSKFSPRFIYVHGLSDEVGVAQYARIKDEGAAS